MGLENGLPAMRASISGSEAIFLLCRGDHCPRAVTIASLSDSGCGMSTGWLQWHLREVRSFKIDHLSGNLVHLGDPYA